MTYQQTIDYLFSHLPMFQRIGAAAYKPDLNNIKALCSALGHPEKKFRSIHVGGTNGKGSTSHLLASVLQESGYKTGLFTSPHLKDFRERVRINGQEISEEEVVLFVEKMKKDFQHIQPSFFEMTTALSFDHFAKQEVDVAIIEVGMGGRLDSTNLITPLVSVITNIGFDHTQFLGETLDRIAFEKAGIIKPQVPVIIGETQTETQNVFIETAQKNCSPIYFADQRIKNVPFESALTGNYQQKNFKTVLQTIEILKDLNFIISEKNISAGFRNVLKNTGFKGRWQKLSSSPLTICDVAHNKEGIKEVLQQIQETPHNNLHIVLGMVNDKNHDEILRLLPAKAFYYFCKPDVLRGLTVETLQEKASKFNLSGEAFPSVMHALKAAQRKADKTDLIFIGGSTFVVAEVV